MASNSQQASAVLTATGIVSLAKIGPVDPVEYSPVTEIFARYLIVSDSDNLELYAANGNELGLDVCCSSWRRHGHHRHARGGVASRLVSDILRPIIPCGRQLIVYSTLEILSWLRCVIH